MQNNSVLQGFIGKTVKDVLGQRQQQGKVIALAEVQKGMDIAGQLDQIRSAVSRNGGGSVLILAVKL